MICRANSRSIAAALFLTLLLMAAAGGCSCSRSGVGSDGSGLDKESLALRERQMKAEAEADAALSKQSSQRRQPPARPKPPPPPVATIAQWPVPETPRKPAKLGRPNDVADWKQNDYAAARRDRDPRLPAAVGYLGKQAADKQAAAELLAKLAESPTPAAADGRLPSATVSDPKLTEAVVAALAANGTPHARQTLERLTLGTLKTTDPQVAATAALKALAAHPSPESEDLLFRVATAPDRSAADDRTAIDPRKLRTAAIAMVGAAASEPLRIRLANQMIAPDTPRAIYDQLWACLKESRSENLAAQVALYRCERLPDAARQTLERHFAEQSRAALRCLLGSPPPARFQPVSGAAASMADPRRAAQLLWSPNVATVVEERLRVAEGSIQGTPLLSFACTIPCPAVRANVLRTLEQYWEEGPKGLAPSNAFDDAVPEPGFVLLVKQLPRPRKVARPSAAKAAKSAATQQIKDRQDRASKQWLDFSENLGRAICRQLWAAALARSESSGRSSNVSVKLPSSANVVASCDIAWPEGLGGPLAGLSPAPLRIGYVRIEQKARPDRLLAYFRRQLPSAGEHVSGHGAWLDDFSIDKKTGSTRSVDVFITKPNKDVAILLSQEQQLVVELLTVECLPQADDRGDECR